MKAQRGIEGQYGRIRTDNSIRVDVVTDTEYILAIIKPERQWDHPDIHHIKHSRYNILYNKRVYT